jgi:hypothetical protein
MSAALERLDDVRRERNVVRRNLRLAEGDLHAAEAALRGLEARALVLREAEARGEGVDLAGHHSDVLQAETAAREARARVDGAKRVLAQLATEERAAHEQALPDLMMLAEARTQEIPALAAEASAAFRRFTAVVGAAQAAWGPLQQLIAARLAAEGAGTEHGEVRDRDFYLALARCPSPSLSGEFMTVLSDLASGELVIRPRGLSLPAVDEAMAS